MFRKTAMLAAFGLAASLFAGNVLAGHPGGISTPGKAKGHSKHQSYGHYRGHGYSRDHRGHGYGHSGYYSGYRDHGYGHHRSRGSHGRVVEYSRHEVHRHGPSCGHSGYSRSSYRSYSPYGYYSRHRDYGRASYYDRDYRGRFWIEFNY